jgi:hypothetical protein
MRDVAVDERGGIVQLAKLLCRRRRINLVHGICGLTRGQVVYGRSNAADPRHNARYLLDRHPFNELLESAQFRYLEVTVRYTSVICEKNVNFSVALKPCNGVD